MFRQLHNSARRHLDAKKGRHTEDTTTITICLAGFVDLLSLGKAKQTICATNALIQINLMLVDIETLGSRGTDSGEMT